LLLVGVVATLRVTDNYTRSGSPPWVVAAYVRCFAPIALACLAALAAALGAGRRGAPVVAVVLAVALVALTHRRLAELTRLPTDVLEAQRAWAWRDTLPRGAKVFFVGRAGKYVLTLPIHGGAGRALRTVSLDLSEPPPDLRAFGPDTYYYRASTCASPPGAAWCDAFERAQHLQPVAGWDLPAVSSMRHLTYVTSRIHTGLFRVAD
jgi:hypothetical protein